MCARLNSTLKVLAVILSQTRSTAPDEDAGVVTTDAQWSTHVERRASKYLRSSLARRNVFIAHTFEYRFGMKQ